MQEHGEGSKEAASFLTMVSMIFVRGIVDYFKDKKSFTVSMLYAFNIIVFTYYFLANINEYEGFERLFYMFSDAVLVFTSLISLVHNLKNYPHVIERIYSTKLLPFGYIFSASLYLFYVLYYNKYVAHVPNYLLYSWKDLLVVASMIWGMFDWVCIGKRLGHGKYRI